MALGNNRFQRRDRMSALAAIDMTPLMDLAFSMLIIFMISTPMMVQDEQKMQITLPKTGALPGDPGAITNFVRVSVDRDGAFFYDKDSVSPEEMDKRLAQLAALTDPPVISIRGDGKAAYENVASLINLVKRNNLVKISLDTQVIP